MNYMYDLSESLKIQADKLLAEAIKDELKKHYDGYYGLPIDELADGDIEMMLDKEEIKVVTEGGDWDGVIKQTGITSFKATLKPITVKLYRRLWLNEFIYRSRNTW